MITEAQASGLPVVAVREGGPVSLIRDRHSGWLVEPDADEIASAVAQLAAGYDRVIARAERTGGPALGGDPVAPAPIVRAA